MKALKVALVIIGVVRIVLGLFVIVLPGQFLDALGPGTLSDSARFFMGAAGAAWIAAGVWAIGAVRDLVRNIIFVKFAITLELLNVAGLVYTGAAGYLAFSDMVVPIIIAAVFAAALLIFYPWRAGREKAAGQ